MLPVLSPWQIGREMLLCGVLGVLTGAVRALLPTRGRAAVLPDILWVGALLTLLQSYAAGPSLSGQLRWYMLAAACLGAGAACALLSLPLRLLRQLAATAAAAPARLLFRWVVQPMAQRCKARAARAKQRRSTARTAKKPTKDLQKQPRLLYNSNIPK